MRFHSGEPTTTRPPGETQSNEPGGRSRLTGEPMRARQAAFEAQKRYMEERFGRNRLGGQKPPR